MEMERKKMNIPGLPGIIVSIAVLIILVYKGINVIIVAPLSAMLVLVFNSIDMVAGYRDFYLGGLGGFVTGQRPIYLWGSVFGLPGRKFQLPGRKFQLPGQKF
jgi:H+/gluconate symporter-like permease